MNANIIKLFVFLILFSIIGTSCKKKETELEEEADIEIINRDIDGDYYVSESGNDNNSGTLDKPFQTIKKAVSIVSPGKIIVVLDGNYDEFVTIKTGGTSEDKKIIIFSKNINGAKCRGFRIEGDYVTIDGFNIESQSPTNWIGIYVKGTEYAQISNNYIHDCPTGGINVTYGAKYASVIDNKIKHNGQWGINLIAFNCLVQGNEISETVQYHPKGDEPGFSGNDADGMRIFGSNHIIKENKIINIGNPDDSANKDPHSDCIQAWDGNSDLQPIITNTIIEGNFFSVSRPSGKGIFINANHGNACHDLIIRNNIIEFCDIGISTHSGEFYNITIANNVFKANLNQSSWGTSMHLKTVTNYTVVNNITIDCHPEHRKITGGSGTLDYNIAWNSDGSTPSLFPSKQAHEIIANPKFVEYTGTHNSNDYHLQSSSPAINAGTTLSNVTDDFEGTNRPQGSAYDIGAFENK